MRYYIDQIPFTNHEDCFFFLIINVELGSGTYWYVNGKIKRATLGNKLHRPDFKFEGYV